jgi:phage-related protein
VGFVALSIGELVGFIHADSSGMNQGLSDAELRMRGFQRDTEGRLRRLNGQFATSGDLIALGLRQGTDAGNRFSISLGRIGSMAGGLAGVAGSVGRIAAMLGAAVPLAAGLAATVANIAPAAGLAATGIVAIQLATYAVKIGMSGVQEAVTAAFDTENPEAFNEALKKLSPNARAFVLELKGMKGQFDALKKDVQDRLFTGLDKVLRGMGQHTLPVVRNGLVNAAGAMNLMARNVGNAAIGLGKSGTLGRAISGANAGLYSLSRVPSQIVVALTQVAAAAAPSFGRLTAAAGTALDGVSQKISDAFHSGRMQEAIETAIDLIGDLAEVAGNIGSVIGSIFSAAQTSGGGFIGTLKEITGALAQTFASPAVQSGLKALFSTMSTLAQTAAPLLGQALSAVAPVLTALRPPAQTLIKALGDGLKPIVAALGPVLKAAAVAVGALVTAVSPLLPVIGQLVAGLLPLLLPALKALTSIFVALTPVITMIADGLGRTLQPILVGLGAVLTQMVTQGARMFMLALQQLAPVLPPLIQLGVQLGKSLGQILAAVAPLLPQIMMLSTQLVTGLLPAIVPLLPPLLKLATLWLRLATGVITTVVIPAFAGLIKFLAGLQAAFQPAIAAVTWLVNKIVGMFKWLYDVLVGHSIIPDMVNAIVRWFAGLPGRAVSALSSLGSRIASVAMSAMKSLGDRINRGVVTAVGFVRGLPGRARSALGNLGGYLWNAGASLINGFISGIRSKVGEVASAAQRVVSAARDFFPFSPAKRGPFSGSGYTTHSGRALMAAFQRGITDGIPGLRSTLQGLPGVAVPGVTGGVAPVGGRGGRELIIRGDGSRISDLLVEVLREAVEVRGGGNVQRALGSS